MGHLIFNTGKVGQGHNPRNVNYFVTRILPGKEAMFTDYNSVHLVAKQALVYQQELTSVDMFAFCGSMSSASFIRFLSSVCVRSSRFPGHD